MPTKPPIKTTGDRFRYPTFIIASLISLILILLVTNGILIYDKFSTSFSITGEAEVTEILNIIQEDSIYDLPSEDEQKLWKIRGLVASLDDPYSDFLFKEEIEDFRSGIDENYEGIGVRFDFQGGIIEVVEVFESGPADQAGVQEGDILKKIEGTEVAEIEGEEIINRIRGPQGSEVKLTFDRNEEEIEFSITRNQINIDNVTLEIKDNLAFVRVTSFSRDLDEQFLKVVLEIKKDQNIQGIVLDLRGNSGGILGQAVEIASYFFEEDTLFLNEVGRDFEKEIRTYQKEPNLIDYPVVVLVDRSTASASEILAAALQENSGSKIIGQNTFGKGVVQKIYDLPGGHALKLTIAKWKTPNGVDVNENGVEPDVEINRNENPEEYVLENFQDLIKQD